MTVAVPNQAATSGRFDTSQFNATGNPNRSREDPREILAYKRGADWLLREIPMMEAFIRAWTNKNVKLRVGPIPCTDGDTIYLRPLPLYDEDEPSQKYLAHMWHEVAHVILSQVYEPANSRKVEHALKVIGDRDYGKPAGHMWNALEDGRVEDRLYKTAPGARKHIVKDVDENTPKIVQNCQNIGNDFGLEHLLLTCEPIGLQLLQAESSAVMLDNTLTQEERAKRLSEIGEAIMEHARQTGDMARAQEIAANVAADIGLLMATYLETAGYTTHARQFEQRVIDAITDPVIAKAIVDAQGYEKSLPVLVGSTRIVLARAREMGFFVDWDPRALDPETGEPQVIDWNKLSDAEKQAIRDQLKNQNGMPRIPGQNEAVIVNLPKELMDELRKQMQNQPQGQGNGDQKQGLPSQPSNQHGGDPSGSASRDQSMASGGDSGNDVDRDRDSATDERTAEQRRADAKAFAEADQDRPVDGSGGEPQQSSTERVPRSDSASQAVGEDAEESDGLDQIKSDQPGRDNRYEAPEELKEAYAEKNAGTPSQDTKDDAGTASVAPGASGEPSNEKGTAQGKAKASKSDSFDEDFDDEDFDDEDFDDEDFDDEDFDDEDFDEDFDAEDDEDDEDFDAEGDEDFDAEGDEQGDAADEGGSAQSGHTEDLEAAAQTQHEYNEQARLKRLEKFREKFGEIEDTIRPPHIDYVTKDEAKVMEAQDEKAQVIKEAMQIEVGEISGSPENKFLFKQRKMKIDEAQTAKAPTLAKYDDVLAGEANRLRAIFKQNKKSGFGGQFEIGSHLKGSALPGFIAGEHLKPFDRRFVPKKLDYSVTLLIDQSGSMAGDKIVMARTALAMQASLLDKLAIPFEILGFSTKASGGGWVPGRGWDYNYLVQHDVFKSFEEGWTPEQRAKVMSITTNDSNLDGLALSWVWDRMQKRHEKVRILMTYSDGQPNPDTDNQIRIMKHIIKKMTLQGCIAIGVGILSHAPEQLYPKSVYCNDVRTLPRLVTKALEEELSKKR